MSFSGGVSKSYQRVYRGMSYEERIELFWEQASTLKLDGHQIALWFGILKYFNEANFPSRCAIQNKHLCTLLGVEIRTLRAARKRLIENNLIYYEIGNAKRQPVYIIDTELMPSKSLPKKKDIEVKKKPQRLVKELIRAKKEKKHVEANLFKEDKPKPRKKAEIPTPTLEDVVKICTDKGMSEEEAKYFYSYYDAQGWVTTGGQKIRRIDSMVNRWLNNNKARNDRDSNANNTKRDERNREVFDDIMSRYT